MENCMIKLHCGDPNEPVTPENTIDSFQHNQELHFAILQMKMKNIPVLDLPTFLYFNIDFSGSMDDECKDGKTKLYHVQSTIINIIKYCAENTTQLSIQVDGFDVETMCFIPMIQVSKENAPSLIQKIKKIKGRGSTNIEIALTNASYVIYQECETGRFESIHHIFLTDGEANVGSNSPYYLSELINTKCVNTFIGFGNHHNTEMLQTFATKMWCDYRFVNNGENAGMVYGEIMHTILRPAIKCVTIDVINGSVYDWRNNMWTSTCEESSIESEITKTYHLRCETTSNLSIRMKMQVYNENTKKYEECVKHIEYEAANAEPLYKYVFRQQTLEVLTHCRDSTKLYISNKECKKELKVLFKKMCQFMRRQNMMTDPFMKLLCEDIVTTYRTIGTSLGEMYCTSRHSSQGRESSFTVQYDEDEMDVHVRPRTSGLYRSYALSIVHNSDSKEEADDDDPFHSFINEANIKTVVMKYNEEPQEQPGQTIPLIQRMYNQYFEDIKTQPTPSQEEENESDTDDLSVYIRRNYQTSTRRVNNDVSSLNQTYSTPGRRDLMTQLTQEI